MAGLFLYVRMRGGLISISEAAEKWGITRRRVQVLCAQNRIPDLTKFGIAWAIPKNAEKPEDARKAKPIAENLFEDIPRSGSNKK
jgi:hypothetical protein